MSCPLACSLVGERPLVLTNHHHRSPLLLRPSIATSFVCVGLLIVFVVYIALPLAVLTPLLASIGGGLVGCGVAGFYCWRRSRQGRSD